MPPSHLHQLRRPLAIAMWDFSWLLRHAPPHGPDDFTDFDRVLDALVDRGYDAVRLDAFPHLIAPTDREHARHEPPPQAIRILKRAWTAPCWGPRYSSVVRPGAALIEILAKCRARGVRVGLSTWFEGHDEHERNRGFRGLDSFVRAWHDTLCLIDEHGLAGDLLYVDLLNEYPLWHGFDWLHQQVRGLASSPARSNDRGHAGGHLWSIGEPHNEAQRRFTNTFLQEAVAALARRWPDLPIFASFSHSQTVPWIKTSTVGFGAMDVHVWAVHYPDCFETTGYLEDMHPLASDIGFARCQAGLKRWWSDRRPDVSAWMDAYLGGVAEAGHRLGVPVGNTEGWGPINWTNHPSLDWDLVRQGGELGVKLALKHGFRFVCTSNFTHPFFTGLWADVGWHRELTAEIRATALPPLEIRRRIGP